MLSTYDIRKNDKYRYIIEEMDNSNIIVENIEEVWIDNDNFINCINYYINDSYHILIF